MFPGVHSAVKITTTASGAGHEKPRHVQLVVTLVEQTNNLDVGTRAARAEQAAGVRCGFDFSAAAKCPFVIFLRLYCNYSGVRLSTNERLSAATSCCVC